MDLKPPLAFVPYAISIELFGKSIAGVRLIGAICLGISAYFTYRIGNHIWGHKVGFLAALMSIIFISTSRIGQVTSPEIIITMPLMGALTILVAWGINARTSFLVGLLLSVAVLIRLNLAYLVVVIGILLCAYPIFIQKRSPIKNIIMYGLGGFIPLAIIIAPYAIAGHLDTLFKSMVVVPLVYSSVQQSAIESLKSILTDRGFFGSHNALLWIGFLGGIALLIKTWTDYTTQQKFKIFLSAIFFLGVIISLLSSGVARYNHLHQIIPLLSFPASLFFSMLFLHGSKPKFAFAFILVLVITSHSVLTQYGNIVNKLANNEPLRSDIGYQLAAYLQKENPSKQPEYLLIYHVVHWLNDTKPLSKYFTHPDTLGKSFMFKTLIDTDATTATELKKMLEKKPFFIVTEKNGGFLKHDPEAVRIFNNTLDTEYFLDEKFGKAYVYRRIMNNDEH